MERKVRFNEAFNFLRMKGRIKTQKECANLMNYKEGTFSRALKGNPDCLTDNFLRTFNSTFDNIFNIDWLLKGEGSMFSAKCGTNILKGDGHEIMGPKHHYNDEIPVIPAWMFRAPSLNIYEAVMSDSNIETLPPVPHFSKHELFARCPGDAMSPRIKRGHLMALDRLDKDAAIINGEIYAVDTWNQGMIIRRIMDNRDGTWTCIPCDQDRFKPFNIERSDVINVFKIVGNIYWTEGTITWYNKCK